MSFKRNSDEQTSKTFSSIMLIFRQKIKALVGNNVSKPFQFVFRLIEFGMYSITAHKLGHYPITQITRASWALDYLVGIFNVKLFIKIFLFFIFLLFIKNICLNKSFIDSLLLD